MLSNLLTLSSPKLEAPIVSTTARAHTYGWDATISITHNVSGMFYASVVIKCRFAFPYLAVLHYLVHIPITEFKQRTTTNHSYTFKFLYFTLSN